MQNKNESGRSMVEMIAVIAVMAILSLGGIAGYTLAMNRMQANHLIDIAGKLAGMGTGGTRYNNLRAAGLSVDVPSVDMSLDEYGIVCVTGFSENGEDPLRDAFLGQAIPYKTTSDKCRDPNIPLNFAKGRN